MGGSSNFGFCSRSAGCAGGIRTHDLRLLSMYSEPAVGLDSKSCGDEGVVRRIALPIELHPPWIKGVGDQTRTDNRCTPTGSRRSQGRLPNRQPTKKVVQTQHITDVVRTGSWPSETPVGVEPTSTGLQPVAWPWLQRQVSSSGVEPDPRPSQGRVRSATPRGHKAPRRGNFQEPRTKFQEPKPTRRAHLEMKGG